MTDPSTDDDVIIPMDRVSMTTVRCVNGFLFLGDPAYCVESQKGEWVLGLEALERPAMFMTDKNMQYADFGRAGVLFRVPYGDHHVITTITDNPYYFNEKMARYLTIRLDGGVEPLDFRGGQRFVRCLSTDSAMMMVHDPLYTVDGRIWKTWKELVIGSGDLSEGQVKNPDGASMAVVCTSGMGGGLADAALYFDIKGRITGIVLEFMTDRDMERLTQESFADYGSDVMTFRQRR